VQFYDEFLLRPDASEFADVQQFRNVPVRPTHTHTHTHTHCDCARSFFERFEQLEKSYNDKDLEAAFMKKSKGAYEARVAPGCLLSRELGNLYCGSVWAGLASLVSEKGNELVRAFVAVMPIRIRWMRV
jgi:hypothetical protein